MKQIIPFLFCLVLVIYGLPSSSAISKINWYTRQYPVLEGYTFHVTQDGMDFFNENPCITTGLVFSGGGCHRTSTKEIWLTEDKYLFDWLLAHEVSHALGWHDSPEMDQEVIKMIEQHPWSW